MPVSVMYENYTKFNTNCLTKWSGFGQENAFLLATILGTEVINHTDTISLRNMENATVIMKDSNIKDCLDQLILVVHLPDVSVTNTNDCSYIL